MRAGALRHRISIQEEILVDDGEGGFVRTWATITNGTVWASVQPLSGAEAYRAQQVQGNLTHSTVIRYLAGVTPKHRVLFGTRLLNIKSVINQFEKNVMLTLLCEETNV